jgi:hypothetical protein
MNVPEIMNWYAAHRRWCVIATIVVATIAVMVLRRPDQWHAPYVWIEDGQQMLPDFIANGWRSVLHPVNGYYVLPARVIGALAATLSFRWLPQIEYWLTLAFTIFVLCAIALSPTRLRLRLACALAVLALPTDSEVFALSPLAFWWGSLLAILPLLWRDEGKPLLLLRAAMLIVGGLSSPLLIALLPLYALRAIWLRTRPVVFDFCVALVVGAAQWHALPPAPPLLGTLAAVPPAMFVRKFFGYFIFVPELRATHEAATLFAGIVFLAMLAVCAWRWRRELGTGFFLLIGGFLAAAVADTLRQPLVELHPFVAGPRYFFLPFTMLSWAVLQLFALDARVPHYVALATFALVVRNALEGGQRDSARFDWQREVDRCLMSDRHDFPISYDGRAEAAWKTTIRGEDCRRMVAQSWFRGGVPASLVP